MKTQNLTEITEQLALTLSEVERLRKKLNSAIDTIESVKSDVFELTTTHQGLDMEVDYLLQHVESIESQLYRSIPYDYL